MQAVADAQDTSVRLSRAPAATLGVAWIAQLLPFQYSASVKPPLPVPTAVQADVDGHDTPTNVPLPWGPVGVGVAWNIQLLPSQCSASVTWLATPTAVQAVVDGHDASARMLRGMPARLGVD